MAGRVGVHVVHLLARRQRAGTEGEHLRPCRDHVVDHDVEVELLGKSGSGHRGGLWSGASWKAIPDVVSFSAMTTQSADR
jgi:hypothetical protein